MLYSVHELQRLHLGLVATASGAVAGLLSDSDIFPFRVVRANAALLHRITKRFDKQPFGIPAITAHGRDVVVTEDVIARHPFCDLVHFARHADDASTRRALGEDPRVLVCAPLSGHHATLVRDTIATLLQDHDVYVTDWVDARQVPTVEGAFHLHDYVTLVERFITELGAADLHVVSVCQPTVPVLAAISRMAARGEATPASATLMGGPIDARVSPTAVNRFATERSLAWFKANMIHRVPLTHPGRGRDVYPGFLQLTSFVMMNPGRHADAYRNYWWDQINGKDEATASHETFYDEYNSVLDMDAAYYLETVRTVFQEFALARGTWDIHGERVRPAAITRTAMLTIEGENDDISGLGQTAAAHALCTGIPSDHHTHVVAEGCGHYGLFSGSKWRTAIYPALRAFIRAHHVAAARAAGKPPLLAAVPVTAPSTAPTSAD